MDPVTLSTIASALLKAGPSLVRTVGGWFGNPELTFEQILGYVFAPIMTMIGVPWSEATGAGSFVGQKVVVNEFVAFADFGPQIESFSPKTAAITTFALTGFANLSSLGILLGGLGGGGGARGLGGLGGAAECGQGAQRHAEGE